MGGRGAGSGGGNLGGGSGGNINIKSETDIWSFRHNSNNEPFVDDINSSISDIQNDFPEVMNTVNTVSASELGGKDKTQVLGYYGQNGLGMNQNYTDPAKMNGVYDKAVAQGFHPSRGNKSGTQAVAYHEMGHALTDHLASKLGTNNIDKASEKIVNNAYKASNGKGGTVKFAKGISGYATKSNAECVAEAVADFYCNGRNASSASKAIVNEMKRINAL